MLPQPARRPAAIRDFVRSWFKTAAVVLLAAMLGSGGLIAVAAPGNPATTHSTMQNVDYLGVETAGRLDLDFTVLVPSYVPSPFGGEPAIDASGGFYSLYWMVTGGPPTFLQVTGEVGGSLPAGSPYDLNNQLSVNASVQGYEAIHDVTPAYDAVWWIAGGVAYKVESLNMEGAGSLDLANSLVGLVAPEPAPEESEEPAESEEPGESELQPEPQPTTESLAPVDSPAPDAETETPADNEVVGPGEPAVEGIQETESVAPEPGEVVEDGPAPDLAEPTVEAEAPQPAISTDGTGSANVSSDGTGGPEAPVVGTDGTGGTSDLSLAP